MQDWTTKEETIMRDWYPIGGVKLCLEKMPYRSPGSIRGKSGAMGLKVKNRKKAQRVEVNEHIDTAITKAFQSGELGAIKALSKKLGLEYGWIKWRALKLGLRVPRIKAPDWTKEENEIIEDNSGKSIRSIQGSLKRRGYKRTESAIQTHIYELQLDIDDDGYNASDVARLMGVDWHVVRRWIDKGLIKSKRIGPRRSIKNDGGSHIYRITRKDLRTFVISNPTQVDIRKVDKFWFIDLLADPDIKEKSKAA